MTTTTIYNQAELALAAYAQLLSGSTGAQENITNLQQGGDGMSEKQAEEFAMRYPTVVTQYNDTDTSFSATVFKDSDGNLTLAIRGTLEAGDFVPTDANIALYGAGYDQIIAMYNWWRRVSTPSGQEVEQYEVHSYINGVDTVPDGAVLLYIEPHSQNDMAYYMIESDSATSTGELVDYLASDSDHKLDVTGHSLGGHLAMAFGSLFPGVTDEITTFNAPGFMDTSVNTSFFSGLGGSIPTGVNTTNVIADEAGVGEVPWSAVAGLHNRPGTAIDIAIENQWQSDEPNPPSAKNHSQQTLTDALAVYATLSKLDPSLDAETFKWVLTNAASGSAASLEHVVDALDELFTKDTNELVVGNNNRDDLYVRLYAIQDSATFINAVGKLKVVQTSSLASSSQQNTDQGLAYRYALVHLNPFAISGDAAIYSQHNGSGELNWYNPADGTGSITDAYIKARSAMLEWKMLHDNDIFGYINKASTVYGNWDYLDLASGVTLAIDGGGTSIYDHQIVFGSASGEPIEGSGDDDRLFGMDGDDTLQGKGGNDYLEGGSGNDTYIYTNGDGLDTILDTDGLGSIKFDGITINGGKEIGTDVYRSEDGKYTYKLIRHTDARQDLMINDCIVIKDFESGELGITLDPAAPYTPPATNDPITGDHTPIVFYNDEHGAAAHWHYDELGNLVVDYGTNEIRDDELFGSSGNDKIQGFMGHDRIDGKEGDDILEGGKDIDIVIGGTGNDEIHAGDWIDIAALDSYANFASSQNESAKGDWLTGGLGEDTVIGSAGNDVLFGGGDGDLILGGDGNDIISGDDNYISTEFDWSVTLKSNPFDMVWNSVTVTDWSGDGGAADTIFGGAGNDYIVGQLGQDLLFGEDGDDILAGHGDADIIYGGMGNDKIAGDYGNITISDNNLPNNVLTLPGNDFLYGGAGNDEIYGDEGDDFIFGGADNDYLYGDAWYVEDEKQGDDYLDGGDGNDTLYGQGGEDILLGGAGEDKLYGGDGADWLEGGIDSDWLYGEKGDDFIFGDEGDDYIDGGYGDDYIYGGLGDDYILGDDSNDWLYGDSGNDYIHGGSGDDIIEGGSGSDFLFGDGGNNRFIFSKGDGTDVVYKGDGTDTIHIQGVASSAVSASLVNGSDSASYLALQYGDTDIVYIQGGLSISCDFEFSDGTISAKELIARSMIGSVEYSMTGAGTAYGSEFADLLVGSMGDDCIYGQDGDDIIIGSSGDDLLYGGQGVDTYRIGTGTGRDTIYESGDSSGIIQLLPGATLDDISYLRQGDDLFIHIKDSRDGVVLDNFYNGDQVWQIEDDNSNSIIIQKDTIPGYESTIYPQTIEEAKDAYHESFNRYYQGLMRIYGYELQEDGSYVKYRESGYDSYRYEYNTAVTSFNTDEPEYSRNLDGITIELTYEEIHTETITETYRPGGTLMYPRSGGSGSGGYCDFDDSTRSISGIRLDGFTISVPGSGGTSQITGYGNPTIAGYWYYSGGVPSEQTRTRTVTYTYREYDYTINIADITGGASDNIIQSRGDNFNLLDGGSGQDILDVRPKEYQHPMFSQEKTHYSQQGLRIPGSLLYGNDGDDKLFGSTAEDTLIGGAGDDYMQGGMGNDTYLILDSSGNDVIYEDGWITNGGSQNDVLVLPYGVSLDDLSASWGEMNINSLDVENVWAGRSISTHTALELSWGTGDSVTIVLPHSNELADMGIDYLQFYDGESITLSAFIDQLGNSPGVDSHNNDNTIQDKGVIYGGAGNDTLTVADDYVTFNYEYAAPEGYSYVYQPNFVVGGTGADQLFSGDDYDYLIGGELYFRSYGESGNRISSVLWDSGDTYTGGKGNDYISTTAGEDTIVFNLGDGSDVVTDILHSNRYLDTKYGEYEDITGDMALIEMFPDYDDILITDPEHIDLLTGSHDTLRFGEDISPDDIAVIRETGWGGRGVGDTDDLVFTHTNGIDEVRFENWFRADINQLNRVEFADGTVWGIDDINAMLNGENRAPVVDVPLSDQTTAEDDLFTFQIPQDTFSDPDAGDTLSLSADLSDGSPLPDWLSFDAAANTLSGTPDNSQVGSLDIRITATDSSGESVSDTFTLDVANVNDAPELVGSVADQQATEDQTFIFTLPDNLFTDIDAGDSLALSACLADGSSLPSWLSFDAATGNFSGTPANDDVGDISLKVIATDLDGATAETIFNLNVINVNDAPELVTPLADVEAAEGDSFSYTIPAGAFRDIDSGDTLIYTATLVDGSALPSWLSLDSDTRMLTGDLPLDAAGEYDITIQATDQSGASVSDTFHLSIANLINEPTWWNHFDGTSMDDLIIGSGNGEWLSGYDGNDQLIAGGGNDSLNGGAGNDRLDGGEGSDILFGGSGDDVLIGDDDSEQIQSAVQGSIFYGWNGFDLFGGMRRNDRLFGGEGNDILQGGAGVDILFGESGDDILDGGSGNDILDGGSGSDIYRFSLQDGQDIISNHDTDPDDLDVLSFDGIASDDLLFSRQWNNLVIDVVGTNDRVTIQNWYWGEDYQLDSIETADAILQNDQVSQLANAMSVFPTPIGGGMVLIREGEQQVEHMLVSSVRWN